MKTIPISRGTTFAFDLTFSTDVQGYTLLLTGCSSVDGDDSDAEIKSSYAIPVGTPVTTLTHTLTPSITDVPENRYYSNWRLVNGTEHIADSEQFIIKIEQGSTTRMA